MADNREKIKPAPNSEERSLTGIGVLKPQPPQEGSNSGQNNNSGGSTEGNNTQSKGQ
jgi:hypothetical protein